MLRLIIAMLPTYFLIVVGSAISASSSLLYMAFLSVIISSLIVSVRFMLRVINKSNKMKKINFHLFFYYSFYLVFSCITFIEVGAVAMLIVLFYLIAFLLGLLLYLTNGKSIRRGVVADNNFGAYKQYNPHDTEPYYSALDVSMVSHPDDFNQAMSMSSAFSRQ